jgi:hypothetical protein
MDIFYNVSSFDISEAEINGSAGGAGWFIEGESRRNHWKVFGLILETGREGGVVRGNFGPKTGVKAEHRQRHPERGVNKCRSLEVWMRTDWDAGGIGRQVAARDGQVGRSTRTGEYAFRVGGFFAVGGCWEAGKSGAVEPQMFLGLRIRKLGRRSNAAPPICRLTTGDTADCQSALRWKTLE